MITERLRCKSCQCAIFKLVFKQFVNHGYTAVVCDKCSQEVLTYTLGDFDVYDRKESDN